jgi:hypothetical protein
MQFNLSSDDEFEPYRLENDELSIHFIRYPSVVVVEEPDEEPKVYQQQAYNANIELKKAAAAAATAATAAAATTTSTCTITPPLTPTLGSPSPSTPINFPAANDYVSFSNATRNRKKDQHESHRSRYVSPTASRVSSSSTTSSYRHRKSKMKYRRQHAEYPSAQNDEQENRCHPNRSSRLFQMPSFTRSCQAGASDSSCFAQHQRFFPTNRDMRRNTTIHEGTSASPFQWVSRTYRILSVKFWIDQSCRNFTQPYMVMLRIIHVLLYHLL